MCVSQMSGRPSPACVPSVGKRRNCARVKLAPTKLVVFPSPLESTNYTLVYLNHPQRGGLSRTRRCDHNDGNEQHAPVRPSCTTRPVAELGCTKINQQMAGWSFCSLPLRCRCELSCIADGQRRPPVACPAVIDATRQTKSRLYFPLRDLERSEYNSGGHSHRTAWADSR